MAEAAKTNLLVIVDPQVDFHEGGSLAVPGANADSNRLAAWIEREGAKITDIVVTLDTHQSYHIGHGFYWEDKNGNPPNPFTLIKTENLMINGGKWQAAKQSDRAWANEYVKKLQATGKFVVCIWPEHCIRGGSGHNVAPAIRTALQSWQKKTKKSITYMGKGECPHTEMYSALKAEVPIESVPQTKLNMQAIQKWDTYSRVIFCGQAQSHCVNFTATDFVANKKSAQVVILKDCQSCVSSFEAQGKDFFKRMVDAKATLVCATDCKL